MYIVIYLLPAIFISVYFFSGGIFHDVWYISFILCVIEKKTHFKIGVFMSSAG